MTVSYTKKPNIKHGIKDQINIALNLFNTIIETANTQDELERSLEVIEQDISICEHWEARKRKPRNQL
jgi:hypothetical protein